MLNFPIPIISSVASKLNPKALASITNVLDPMEYEKDVIAVLSINWPLQKNTKLSSDVAGNGTGAVNQP